MGGVKVSKGTREKRRKCTKEEDTMAATAKNFVYEVKPVDSKRIIAQPAVSEAFLKDCKKVANKYRKK